jgi:glyoxylase-like metal-dependent hydrolase (beta-lactamase superfamily II)
VPGWTFDAAPGIVGIDTMMAGTARLTAAYLVRAERPALIETGPATSVARVADALETLGMGHADLAHVVVTHIHLDHAGGAGAISGRYPLAKIWVHERGARHLADPARLVASTIRTYGAEHVATMFGTTEAVPADRLRPMLEGTTIDLGDRSLTVMDAPGHASNEVFLMDSATGALFTGDGLGTYLPELHAIRPAAPAPEFDLEMALASIRRARSAGPSMLLFSHFGPALSVDGTCELAIERLETWTGMVRSALRAGIPPERIEGVLRAATTAERAAARSAGVTPIREEFLWSYGPNAAGIVRYLSKTEPAPVKGPSADRRPASGPGTTEGSR